MAATSRMETDMKRKQEKILRTSNDPIEKLRAQCLKRGAGGIKGISRVFRIMDDDGNKSLSFAEFKKGLYDYGVMLDEDDEYLDAFQRFDTNRDGSLNFEEFLKQLRPPMSKRRKQVIRQAFNKIDRDHNGVLTVDDLKGVYNVKSHPKYRSGELSEDAILRLFLDTFDTPDHGDGQVTWEEFLNYYCGVSVSVDDDCYFDLMMRQAWKLD